MFVVNKCVLDYESVLKNEVARFMTKAEAEEFAKAEDCKHSFGNIWHEVEKVNAR